MSSGLGKGDDRINDAIRNALHSPLLNNNDVFSAKKILINISFSVEFPLMMDEIGALHNFMSKFSREIEVIWGAAVEESLGEEVKVTLLATGFSITSVPGIRERQEEKTRAEEIQEQIERDAKLAQEKRTRN